jgi:ribosomal-protein-alanine N-acetyltransferase
MTILQTPRLLLREFIPEDADVLAQVLSDPETMRYYPAPRSSNGLRETGSVTLTTASAFGLWS